MQDELLLTENPAAHSQCREPSPGQLGAVVAQHFDRVSAASGRTVAGWINHLGWLPAVLHLACKHSGNGHPRGTPDVYRQLYGFVAVVSGVGQLAQP